MRSRLSLAAAVLLVISMTVVADEPKPAAPKSQAALAAIAKHKKAVADAERAYQDAKKTADQQLVTELKAAQATALKAGGPTALAEGNAIQAVIDDVGAAAAAPAGTAKRPAGKFRMGILGSSASREYVFGNDGSVAAIENGRPVPIGNLLKNGNAWVFTEPKVDRVRKIFTLDGGYLVVASFSTSDAAEPENFATLTPIK